MSALVSCIMATRDRPHLFAQALRLFLGQTYADSELVVVDDGEQPVRTQCAALDRVRYVRLERQTPTGTKLNTGIAHARGDLLQKLDDDDYYHPGFLETAVRALLSTGSDHAVAGWDCFLVLLAGERQLRFSGYGWTAGGTLCFSRKLWQRVPFRDVPVDEDYWFLQDCREEPIPVRAPELYILVRHGRNTWVSLDNGTSVDTFLRELPRYPKPLRRLVDTRTLTYYKSLRPCSQMAS